MTARYRCKSPNARFCVHPPGACEKKHHEPYVPTLDDVVARMKGEILEDQSLGKFKPRGHRTGKVACFADLHDYVDANEYGGFCDDEWVDRWVAHFGGPSANLDGNAGYPDAYLDFINAAQDAIDAWIKAGGLR